ncbi:MAG: FHA domain-containing protein [Gammaproteobacteria bacterium]|nr:FHA domain-containing protein [Gammaproteobacteria bacterium]NND53590.1 FHA domain-containing protein [Gammaproteobacteria bacterium]
MARLILSLGGQVLAEFNMTKERYTVGRLPDNDIRIDNPAVSGHHSLVINILNDSFLEDLSSTNGTYVNGKLIKKHALQHGDVITVGHHQLRFAETVAEDEEQDDEFARTMIIDSSQEALQKQAAKLSESAETEQEAEVEAAVAAAPKPIRNAKMQVMNGKFAGREVELNKALTTLGSPGAQVIAVTKRSEGYFVVMVENKKPDNPPKINGEPLGSQARKLDDNDIVELIGIKMGFFSS